jgi:hypothetical protein
MAQMAQMLRPSSDQREDSRLFIEHCRSDSEQQTHPMPKEHVSGICVSGLDSFCDHRCRYVAKRAVTPWLCSLTTAAEPSLYLQNIQSNS